MDDRSASAGGETAVPDPGLVHSDGRGSASGASPEGLGRREVLGLGLGLAAVAGAGGSASGVARTLSGDRIHRSRAAARNVIFMVSDGMSQGTWTLAELASRARMGRPSAWARLLMQPGVRRGQSTTDSADGLVTDSAAAGSAWGTGVKVVNGSINVTPDGREPVPLLVRAREAGRRTGLVTTTEITHATPASFVANVSDRARAAEIGRQLLERGVDVLLGGGADHLPAADLAQPDIRLVHRAEQLARAAAEPIPADGASRLVGMFAGGHLPYELDRPTWVPTLAAMTEAALRRLVAVDAGRGFVLQVEGGRVDHAAHANDAGGLLAEQLAFDDAVAVAMQFVARRDDTLLIVTTDHGNANPGLTLYGERGNRAFERLLGVRRSFDWIWSAARTRAGDGSDPAARLDALVSAIRDATAIEPDAADRAWLARTVVGDELASVFEGLDSATAALGQVLARHVGVGFVSTNHTSDLVEVVATGPGAGALEPLIDNVDLHRLVVDAAGVPG